MGKKTAPLTKIEYEAPFSFNIPQVHVDYITCTAKSQERRAALRRAAGSLLDIQVMAGYRRKSWQWLGYVGETVGSLKIGSRQDGDIVIVSGDLSELARKLLVGIPQNVSRLDIAFDVILGESDTVTARQWFSQKRGEVKTDEPRDEVCQIVNLNGGYTLYFGKREAELFGRVYDKGVQTGLLGPGVHWRLECEFKGRAAMSRWENLARTTQPQLLMAGWVKAFFLSRGFTWLIDMISNTEKAPRKVLFAKSPDSAIMWLQTQVAPAVKRLIDQGLAEEVERALGYQLNFQSDLERKET